MNSSALLSGALVLISVALLGFCCFAWRLSRKLFHTPLLVDVIFFFVLVKLVFYYALPTVLRILSDYQFEKEDMVRVGELVRLYAVEMVSWIAWATVLAAVFRIVSRGKRQTNVIEFVGRKGTDSRPILVILAVGLVMGFASSLKLIPGNFVLELFKALFLFAGLACGPTLMILSLRYFGKILFVVGVLCSLLSLLVISTRGAMLYFALFCLFLILFVLRDRKSKLMIAALLLVGAASYFVYGGLFLGSIRLDRTRNLSFNAAVDTQKKGTRSTIGEVEWRFGAATRMGTAFFRLYDRGEAAGINPIMHSLLGFLPRSVSPDKPIPSTLNGDNQYTQGMYMIYREIHGYQNKSMTEFPTGAHFYWEFGMIGVLLLSALSGLYVALCAHYFSRLGIVAVPLMVAVFKPWGYMDPKIWVSDIVIQIYQIILPLILLVVIVRTLHVLFKGIKETVVPL